ncbi:MAG: chromosome segregation protein SMC [bacterium]
MHLREVHMENFKTFKGKFTVPFEPGFTAITGPNGSGKSNIGDAIMFVLGPNSPRAMRAKSLSDLIFNGGKEGKPAEAASVSLVFDNTDRIMPVEEDTVVLTRRIKRAPSDESPDGCHSYFYVNGRGSQKKEFVDLLDHARISADGYNITLQGDVQSICNMTPVDRRRILDDIAGVTTFDRDLASAENRRSDVQANLERIGIVLDELKRSLDQLDKEKDSAQRYRDLQDGIKRCKGLMAMRRRDDVGAQIAHLHTEIERFSKEREKHGAELAALKDKHKETEARFAELEAKIRAEGGAEVEALQDRMKAARDEMVRLEERINFAKGELATAHESSGPMADELRRIERDLSKTKALEAECGKEHAQTTQALELRKKELDGARDLISKGDTNAMQINRELVALKQEHEAKQTELHEAKLESDRVAERAKAVAKALAEATQQDEAVDTDLKESSWQLKELRGTAGGAGKKRKDAEKRLFELRKAQAEFGKQAEELEMRIRRLQRDLADLRANEEAAARAQGGYGQAVQDVLSARDKREIKGVIGTVAELAKVDKKHSEAMQIAAAGRLQAIVVEDDSVAAQCIDLVKRRQSGRVTLLPLNKMVPGRPSGQALMKVKEQGCLGFALDLIEFNPRYQNAFWHVFQDTLVADTMANGRRMMGGVRIVTLDGELFEKSGAMTGGKQSKGKGDDIQFTNADRGRMDELLGEIAKAEEAQQEAVAKAAAARKELDDLQAALAAEGAAGASQEDRLKELERKVTALEERKQVLAKEQTALAKDGRDTEAASAKLAKATATLEERLAQLEKLRQDKGQLLLKGTRKDLRERVEKLEAEVRELTEAALKAENRRQVAATQLQLVAARRDEVAAQIDGGSGSAAKLAEDVKKFTAAYGKAKAEVEAILKMEKKATGALKGLNEQRDRAYKDLTDLKARIDKVADRMETHFGLVTNAKSKLPLLEEALGDAKLELQENPVEVKAGEDVPPIEDLKRELRNQESALDRLGPVNQTALEQHDAQSARAKELKDEVARLENQKGELLKLVDEIATNKKAALMTVLTAVNEQFASVYGLLTKGGKAYLELENEKAPFDGGLILKAQPPEKKVTRIDSLSGGEKSLTSMAFIFAIQRYDPSPFYYFDEVDQNLDAVNSEFLARMIKDNARFAQFIVVSLRKITLKEASHIYGVTQVRPGVSEIIARFDLDTLPSEGDVGASGAGGDDGDGGGHDVTQGFDGEGGQATKKKAKAKEKPKAAKETTITQLMERAVSVEVKP